MIGKSKENFIPDEASRFVLPVTVHRVRDVSIDANELPFNFGGPRYSHRRHDHSDLSLVNDRLGSALKARQRQDVKAVVGPCLVDIDCHCLHFNEAFDHRH